MAQDALSQIFNALKMRGTIYFHTNLTAPFGLQVPQYRNVARFHMALRGQCWVRIEGVAEPVSLAAGDLVVIPHGVPHILSDTPERKAVALDDVLQRTGYKGEGALVYGGAKNGHANQLFCGHFEFDEGVMHPLLDALPSHIHIANTESMNASWLEPVMRFVSAEVMGSGAGSNAIIHRLTEIIFIQVVRAFVNKMGDAAGTLAGVLDPQLSKALAEVHAAPEKPWTVNDMARVAGMSRTLFAQKFTALIGMTPLGYVTQWRMQMAKRALVESKKPEIEIAESIGYQSESAFARAFKREFNATPSQMRRAGSVAQLNS